MPNLNALIDHYKDQIEELESEVGEDENPEPYIEGQLVVLYTVLHDLEMLSQESK